MRLAACLATTLLASCTISTTLDKAGEHDRPPELGRSRWVRVVAGTGGWIGGLLGGVVAIALLPIDYPLSLLASDGHGEHARSEFLWWPAVSGAAFGHAILGGPADALDYLGYRVWTKRCDLRQNFDHVPMLDATLPTANAAAASPSGSAAAGSTPLRSQD